MNTQNAHPHRLFVPEKIKAVPAPPAIRDRLAQLRAEALGRARALASSSGGLFVMPKAG